METRGSKKSATEEQLFLSNFIKSVHQNLRNNCKVMDYHEAWDRHCSNETQLKLYAEAMKKLAINYWDINMSKNAKELSRIFWLRDMCLDYFWNHKLQYYRDKEHDVAKKMCMTLETNRQLNNYNKPIKMLDVGSCYNPFSNFSDYFDVLPIDIAPAISDVYTCDFIKVEIGASTEKVSNRICKLEEESFHVVVFSLLMEYLPTPEFRLLCCEKAYKLLKYEGLLLIITPDSKHVGANAKLMKSWQYILSQIGFSRIKYEKLQHIHCMAFRKNISAETAQRWTRFYGNSSLFDKFYIPQDFISTNDAPNTKQTTDISYVVEHFSNFVNVNELFE